MPDMIGLLIGTLSVICLFVLYQYADELGDGNIDKT